MFGALDRTSVVSRAIEVKSVPSNFGSFPTRPEIQQNQLPIITHNPTLTHEEFSSLSGTKLSLTGEGSADIEVAEGAKALRQYLSLPASEYSTNVLKGFNNKIHRVDSKTFYFELDKINILG